MKYKSALIVRVAAKSSGHTGVCGSLSVYLDKVHASVVSLLKSLLFVRIAAFVLGRLL